MRRSSHKSQFLAEYLNRLNHPGTGSASAPPCGHAGALQPPQARGGGLSCGLCGAGNSAAGSVRLSKLRLPGQRARGSKGFESCGWQRLRAIVRVPRGRGARQVGAAPGRPRHGKGGGGGQERGALSVCLSPRPPSAYRPPLRARGGASRHPLWMPSVLLPRECQESPRRRGQEGHWAGRFPSQDGSEGEGERRAGPALEPQLPTEKVQRQTSPFPGIHSFVHQFIHSFILSATYTKRAR